MSTAHKTVGYFKAMNQEEKECIKFHPLDKYEWILIMLEDFLSWLISTKKNKSEIECEGLRKMTNYSNNLAGPWKRRELPGESYMVIL